MTKKRKPGRPIEPRTQLTLSVNVPAASTPADELRATMTHPEILAWLNAQRGRGLSCPRIVEVEVFAGRKPRVVILSAR